MPSYTRGRLRDKTVYVLTNASMHYGFRTKDLAEISGVSSANLLAQLGHKTPAEVTGTTLMVFGANSPKPARVSKRIASGTTSGQATVSTFCAYNKISTAIGAGWTVGKTGRSVPLRSTGRTVTAVVDLGTNQPLYCFPMNADDFAQYSADLGLQSAASVTSDTELARLVVGSSQPKPGRATKTLNTGSSFSSFYAPAKKSDLQSSTGWRVNSDAILLTPAAGGGGGGS